MFKMLHSIHHPPYFAPFIANVCKEIPCDKSQILKKLQLNQIINSPKLFYVKHDFHGPLISLKPNKAFSMILLEISLFQFEYLLCEK